MTDHMVGICDLGDCVDLINNNTICFCNKFQKIEKEFKFLRGAAFLGFVTVGLLTLVSVNHDKSISRIKADIFDLKDAMKDLEDMNKWTKNEDDSEV